MQIEDIKSLSLEELSKVLKSWGEPAFHAQQIFAWIYKKKAKDFAAMTNLPSQLREKLKQNFSLSSLKLRTALRSSDATEKFLFELKDGNLIEAVSIPTQKRITGCVSSQVGCKFACRFCASGALGFKRNLTSAEMLEEVLSFSKVTHVVFMGTGEPLDNYDNVLKAIRAINSPEGINIGARRITISTSGIIPGIKRLAEEGLQIELSVSLHAADNQARDLIMPVNKKYPLKELIGTCKEYIRRTNRQVTFEYILIAGLNSDLQSARDLGTMLKGMNCKVNLIPANPVKELKVLPPEKKEILLFRGALLKSAINVTLRRPRGEDIDAACGQLRLRHEKE